MSSEKKVLNVNLSDFSFAPNKTQKKKPTSNKIKMKPPKMPTRNETMRKRALLRMIREQQQKNYNEMFTEKKDPPSLIQSNQIENKKGFNSSFEQAKEYLNKLQPSPRTSLNTTLKNQQPIQQSTSVNIPPTPVSQVISQPEYGCLKNGNLPTYRNWLNKTSSHREPLTINKDINDQQYSAEIQPKELPKLPIQIEEEKSILPTYEEPQKKQTKYKRQKRRVVRTYKLGRSKYYSKIGVLVSNKTVRRKISDQQQQLKLTPITEVKRYLIKNGFIKVGSTTPNDVLRKMFESALMLCGEVKNHNSENLLFNYMNSEE